MCTGRARVLTPLRRVGARGEGKFEPISWDEAFEEIVPRLKALRAEYGASSVAFYSGYNKWYRPFLQRLCYSFGSVNYGTESSSCFTSTIMSWRLAAGVDCATPDLRRAGIFLGWCYNAYYAQYLMAGAVERARARGMKVIIVDPRITPAVEKQCDLHLRMQAGHRLRPGPGAGPGTDHQRMGGSGLHRANTSTAARPIKTM